MQLYLFQYLEPWQEFMTKYLQVHPDLVADESLRQSSSSSQSTSMHPTTNPPTQEIKRDMSFQPPALKKLKCVQTLCGYVPYTWECVCVSSLISLMVVACDVCRLSSESELSDMLSRQPQRTSPVVLVTGISQSVSKNIQDVSLLVIIFSNFSVL